MSYRIDIRSSRGGIWQRLVPHDSNTAAGARRACRVAASRREDFGEACYRLVDTIGLDTVEQYAQPAGARLIWRDTPHSQALPGADPLVSRAAVFAKGAHGGNEHRRKYTNEPYITHPAAVADIIAGIEHTPFMLAAAFLHDVVEDTPIPLQRIEAVFGAEVAALVGWVTDVSRPSDGNRAVRKALDRDHLARAPSQAQTIKVADLIDNSASILMHDRSFARVYIPEKAALLDVLTDADPELLERARNIVDTAMLELA